MIPNVPPSGSDRNPLLIRLVNRDDGVGLVDGGVGDGGRGGSGERARICDDPAGGV